MGNFGDDLGRENFLLARSFFDAAPERAAQILETLGVRYLVIRSMAESRRMARALFGRDGSRLGRYRLLYESSPLPGVNVPSHKIFEFVKGADVFGHAPAHSLVKAEIGFETNLGREAHYEAVVESDAAGGYHLRLPYATRGHEGAIKVAERYRIRVGGTLQEFTIDEAAVLGGLRVEGPSF
jgi:dolichyl-diphosphooligosaccharide--protein glycosyltransferase